MAIEAGADPKIAATWIAEVQGERLSAERVLDELAAQAAPTVEQVRTMVAELGDIVVLLAAADPRLKAAVYADLGPTLTYRPDERLVLAEARPMEPGVRSTCRRGTRTLTPQASAHGEFLIAA